jgi:SAM-dependent methyltransferase
VRAQVDWRPTKFVQRDGKWRASRDRRQLNPASRLVGDRSSASYVAALRTHARGDLLDLGCGFVPLYGAYRELVTSTTCVDWPSTLHSSPHLDLEADLSQPLKLPDASFDTVLLTDVLEHLPKPDLLWGELRRLLRPAGKAIVGVPFLYWLHEIPHDHHRYTEYRLRLFADEHGFEVLELAPYGGDGDVLFDTTAKFLASKRLARPLARPVMALATRRRYKPRPLTLMPLGYTMVVQKQ